MNHPYSSCQPWMSELVEMSEVLRRAKVPPPGFLPQSQPADHHDLDQTEGNSMDCDTFFHQEEQYPDSYSDPLQDVDAGPFVDYYPDAANVHGRGSTFMDLFDSDVYAMERETNLYYPFASKQDWEVGSWLLRSGLSMAKIDQFLSLELVNLSILIPIGSI